MSRGYVAKTDVIPAMPPHTNLWIDDKSAPGVSSKNYHCCYWFVPLQKVMENRTVAHLFIEAVAAELDGGIWYNPNAVRSIASHVSSPSLLAPYLG